MLAARDQENLAHFHQSAATSKTLNRKGSISKGNLNRAIPKTPLKVPLNDENVFDQRKTGFKRGHTELPCGAEEKDKLSSAVPLVTPRPAGRAALGPKTTNGKAKATTINVPGKKELHARAQKVSNEYKIKLEPTNSFHIQKLSTNAQNAGEREIEYMPPPVKDLPDFPDQSVKDLELSMLKPGNLTRGAMEFFIEGVEADGLSYSQRQGIEQDEWERINGIKDDALILKLINSETLSCIHEPECPPSGCRYWIAQKKQAARVYSDTISELDKSINPPTNVGSRRNEKDAVRISNPKNRKHFNSEIPKDFVRRLPSSGNTKAHHPRPQKIGHASHLRDTKSLDSSKKKIPLNTGCSSEAMAIPNEAMRTKSSGDRLFSTKPKKDGHDGPGCLIKSNKADLAQKATVTVNNENRSGLLMLW